MSQDRDLVSHRFVLLGMFLFFLGLITGFGMPAYTNMRMGLAAHLEGLMNGTFLVVLGLAWSRINLGPRESAATFWLLVYAAFANWGTVFFSAILGAGEKMMPIASKGVSGSPAQELVISVLLASVGITMVLGMILVIRGLMRKTQPS